MNNRESIYREISEERDRQDKKWGEQNHSPYKWLAIIQEELGEAAESVLHADESKDNDSEDRAKRDYRQELIQVAASAIAAIECLDRSARNWKASAK